MDRQTLQHAVVALLGGIAVALAAANLSSSSESEGLTGGDGGASGDGSLLMEPPDDVPVSLPDFPWYVELLLTGVLIVLVVLAVYSLIYNWREILQDTLRTALVFTGVMISLYLIFVLFPDQLSPGEFGFGTDSTFGISQGNTGGTLSPTEPPVIVLVLVLVGVIVSGVGALFSQSGTDEEESAEDQEADEPTTEAIGRAAGRVADRLEDADASENEIYRAWAEMGRLVDPSKPETKTTAEFERAAVDAGLEPGDVRELTRLFEQVRYGTDAPSERDEQRAISLFRDIEETYTEGPS